jgi:RND family efflux transporter MFP subunit
VTRCAGGRLRALIPFLAFFPGLVLAAEFTGLIVPRHDILVSTGVAAAVMQMQTEVGRRVKEGQLLVQLDDRLPALEAHRRRVIFEDESELRAARERVRILKPLADDSRRAFQAGGSVSREELSRLELDLSAALARLDQLAAQKVREKSELDIADQERLLRRVVAPVSGIVTRVDLELGEWAKIGEPMLQIVDADVCYLRVNITPMALRRLKLDQQIPISFEPSLRIPPVRGRISYLSPGIDAASGLVEIRVTFQNPGWRVPPGVKGSISVDED